MMPDLFWASILLCMVVGAAIDTSNICLFRAATSLAKGNAMMIIGIVLVTASASVVYYLNTRLSLHHRPSRWAYPSWKTIAGAALFACGTILNGNCAVGTVGRIARGDIGHLATFVGAFSVAWLIPRGLPAEPVSQLALMQDLDWLLIVLAFAVLVMILGRRHLQGLQALPYLLLGITAALVTDWQGSWTWLSFLQQFKSGTRISASALIFIAAVLSGAGLAAWYRGHFKLVRPRPGKMLRELFGGGLMVAGAILIPGANDALSVYGVPSGSPDAVVGYLVMFGLIVTTLRLGHLAESPGGARID